MNTRVADLAPLHGMPLVHLNLEGLDKVSDLSPLKGMPLEFLNLRKVPVTDLSPLAECKSLRELIFHTTHVGDLSPLRGLRNLEWLDCSGEWPKEGKLSDLGPLRGLPLTKLNMREQPHLRPDSAPRDVVEDSGLRRDSRVRLDALKRHAPGKPRAHQHPDDRPCAARGDEIPAGVCIWTARRSPT